jgi:hypothetical protein
MTTTFDRYARSLCATSELPPERLQRHAARGDRARFARDHRARLPDRGRVQDHGRDTIPPSRRSAIRDYVARLVAERDAKPPCAEARAQAAGSGRRPASGRAPAPRAAGTNGAGVASCGGTKRAPANVGRRRAVSQSARARWWRARGEARRRHRLGLVRRAATIRTNPASSRRAVVDRRAEED